MPLSTYTTSLPKVLATLADGTSGRLFVGPVGLLLLDTVGLDGETLRRATGHTADQVLLLLGKLEPVGLVSLGCDV